MVRILTISFLLLSLTKLSGQTCCSGGVPFSSNLGFPTTNQGTFQLALAYDDNRLLTLYDEGDVLVNSNRERKTRSFFLRLGYGISERWSVETLMPYVNQRRNITQNNGEINRESSSGIGDIILLVKYDLFKNLSWVLNMGAGIKIPTGSTHQLNNRGLLLVNDMQPGSGAMDIVFRFSLSHQLGIRPSTTLYISPIVNIKGSDDNYLGSQSYQFGNDLQMMSGLSDQVIIGEWPVYPNIGFRYRYARRDRINGVDLDNTGGSWLFTRLGLGTDFYKNNRLTFTFELPLITNVDGTQLSPDAIFNLTYSNSFSSQSPRSINLNTLQ